MIFFLFRAGRYAGRNSAERRRQKAEWRARPTAWTPLGVLLIAALIGLVVCCVIAGKHRDTAEDTANTAQTVTCASLQPALSQGNIPGLLADTASVNVLTAETSTDQLTYDAAQMQLDSGSYGGVPVTWVQLMQAQCLQITRTTKSKCYMPTRH